MLSEFAKNAVDANNVSSGSADVPSWSGISWCDVYTMNSNKIPARGRGYVTDTTHGTLSVFSLAKINAALGQ